MNKLYLVTKRERFAWGRWGVWREGKRTWAEGKRHKVRHMRQVSVHSGGVKLYASGGAGFEDSRFAKFNLITNAII